MHDHELEKALDAIPPLLSRISQKGETSVSFPQLVDMLGPEAIGEEAVRLAMWYLIDRGAIELTSDWRVRPLKDEVSAQ